MSKLTYTTNLESFTWNQLSQSLKRGIIPYIIQTDIEKPYTDSPDSDIEYLHTEIIPLDALSYTYDNENGDTLIYSAGFGSLTVYASDPDESMSVNPGTIK